MFERKLSEFGLDSDLFSGLLSAIQSFTSAIHIGILTSFTTLNKKILISLTENIVVALILDIRDSTEEWQGKAYEIGHDFDQTFDLNLWKGNRDQFLPFNEKISLILQKEKDSFVVQVAQWAAKEFGGEIHIDEKLLTSSDQEFLVNIIIDRGMLQDIKFREKIISKVHKGYNRDLIFLKVIDDIVGLKDAEEYIESCKDLGFECHQKDRCDHYFDYFPSKIIIIAREFAPPAIEKIHQLTYFHKKENNHFIISNCLPRHTRNPTKNGKIKMFQCQVELWIWKVPYPERFFS
ncbi:MAG TPA: hypothetical protein VMV49_15565 [Candidatus Deferrimicrobium sp.]|nr:hypothetical protein [Candidatus Deferrimicrobium sp.]